MKKIIILIMLLAIVTTVIAIEECDGNIYQEDVPCLIFLPVSDGCTDKYIKFYYQDSLLETRQMDTFTDFYCNVTFNYTTLGTYVFNFSTGDTGSLIVEEDNMLNIWQLGIYGFMFTLGLVFIIFMHIFKEDAGSSVVYGGIATAIFSIMGAMLVSGFELIKGVTFFFDINYYLVGLCFSIAVYTLIVSVNLWKVGRPRERGLFE